MNYFHTMLLTGALLTGVSQIDATPFSRLATVASVSAKLTLVGGMGAYIIYNEKQKLELHNEIIRLNNRIKAQGNSTALILLGSAISIASFGANLLYWCR
jgi:hypothetical protein